MIAQADKSVEEYLHQIRQIPRLTQQEEHQLVRASAEGDPEAICRLVDANLRLVVSVAMGYDGGGVPLLDLIQEGSIGLLTAAKKFDPSMNCRFSTYATKWIRHGVTRCIMKHSGLIRISQRTAEAASKIRKAQAQLGTDASIQMVAAYCGMEPRQVEKTLALLPEVCSIEEDLLTNLEDETSAGPYQELVRQELKNTVGSLMQQLTPRQQQVLSLRFGMVDGICHSLEQIGNQLGISKERARQVEHEAVEKLQKLSAGLGLEDFLDP